MGEYKKQLEQQPQEIHLPQEQRLQEQPQRSYYIHQQQSPEQVEISKHMKKSKISSIRAAVVDRMPEAYNTINAIRSNPQEDMRKVTLHHGRAKTLYSENGQQVLKLDIAGSGFSQFRASHLGLKGKDNVTIDGKDYKLEESIDSQLEKEATVSWYNRSFLSRLIKRIRTPEQINAANELLRQKNAHIREEYATKKELFQRHFGDVVTLNGKEYKNIYKKRKITAHALALQVPWERCLGKRAPETVGNTA